jgi:hypothetical protein
LPVPSTLLIVSGKDQCVVADVLSGKAAGDWDWQGDRFIRIAGNGVSCYTAKADHIDLQVKREKQRMVYEKRFQP